MARSHESLWLWVGAGFTAVGAALMAIAGGLDAAPKVPYSLWTSFPMIIAYVMFGLALACLACAARGVPFPFAIGGQETPPAFPSAAIVPPAQSTAGPPRASWPVAENADEILTATPEPRLVCPLSPKELIRLFSQGATELQGESLVGQYKTQWREVSATVELVTPQNEIVFSVSAKDSDEVSVVFLFSVIWVARFQGIETGDEIRTIGRVAKVTSSHVVFDRSELA